MTEELKPRLLLGAVEPSFEPDVIFGVEGGQDIKNLDLETPVRIYHRYCDDEKAAEFQTKKSFKVKELVKMFCTKITGLEDAGVTDGASLIKAPKTDATLSMIDQVFEKIIRADSKRALKDERDE